MDPSVVCFNLLKKYQRKFMQNFNLFLTNLGGLNDVLLFDFEVTRPKKDSVESVKYNFKNLSFFYLQF